MLTNSIPAFVNVVKDNIVDWLLKDDYEEGFEHLSVSDILVARYDDTGGTLYTQQLADLEDDESFATKEYIQQVKR